MENGHNEIINKAIKDKQLLAIKAEYNKEAIFFYATKQSKDFILGVEEFDFALEGYQIRLKEDITNAFVVDNFSAKINDLEGLPEQVVSYPINLETFETIFKDLERMNQVISIEREYDDEDNFFLIGNITEVTATSVWFRNFDVEGKWDVEINIIPYETITTIRFNSRYINIWEKYLDR